jgi:hypothetical protein
MFPDDDLEDDDMAASAAASSAGDLDLVGLGVADDKSWATDIPPAWEVDRGLPSNRPDSGAPLSVPLITEGGGRVCSRPTSWVDDIGCQGI